MPVSIDGDGVIAGVSNLGGGDFVAGSVTSSGELIAGPQAPGRATVYVDSANNCLSVNTLDAPPAGVFVQVVDETDPAVSLNNLNGGEVKLGCTTTDGYIGTESATPFVLTTASNTRVHIAANGNVGINNNSPDYLLSLRNSVNQLGIDTGDVSQYGTLNIGHFDNGAFIKTIAGTNAASNVLRFGTSNTECVRINQNGNVIISKNLGPQDSAVVIRRDKNLVFDPTHDNGQVGGGEVDTCTVTLRNDAANENDGVGNFAQIMFDTGGVGQSICRIAAVRTGNSSNDLVFTVEQANNKREAARFTGVGNLAFPAGQGIDFSASQGVNAVSSILDDYEEGTWTPVFVPESGSFSITYTQQTGTYTKIGRMVYAEFSIAWQDYVAGGNILTISTLPYSAYTASNIKGFISNSHGIDFDSWGGIEDASMLSLQGYSVNRVTTSALNTGNTNSDGRGKMSMLRATGIIQGSVIFEVV